MRDWIIVPLVCGWTAGVMGGVGVGGVLAIMVPSADGAKEGLVVDVAVCVRADRVEAADGF